MHPSPFPLIGSRPLASPCLLRLPAAAGAVRVFVGALIRAGASASSARRPVVGRMAVLAGALASALTVGLLRGRHRGVVVIIIVAVQTGEIALSLRSQSGETEK